MFVKWTCIYSNKFILKKNQIAMALLNFILLFTIVLCIVHTFFFKQKFDQKWGEGGLLHHATCMSYTGTTFFFSLFLVSTGVWLSMSRIMQDVWVYSKFILSKIPNSKFIFHVLEYSMVIISFQIKIENSSSDRSNILKSEPVSNCRSNNKVLRTNEQILRLVTR